MPTLKDLNCSIEVGEYDRQLTEYQQEYGDAFVCCSVVVPDEPTTFSMHLSSNAYIANGLCAMVWIDGVYQGNKLHTNLRRTSPSFPKGKLLDLRMRQMIRPNREHGLFTGSQWVFDRLRIGNVENGKTLHERVKGALGTIDVVILRANSTDRRETAVETSNKLRVSDRKTGGQNSWTRPRTSDSGRKQVSDRGSLFGGLFDGSGDLDQQFSFPAKTELERHDPARGAGAGQPGPSYPQRYQLSQASENDIADFAEFQRWKRAARASQLTSLHQEDLVRAVTQALRQATRSPSTTHDRDINRLRSGPINRVRSPNTNVPQSWHGELLAASPPPDSALRATYCQSRPASVQTCRWGNATNNDSSPNAHMHWKSNDNEKTASTQTLNHTVKGGDGNNSMVPDWDTSKRDSENVGWGNSGNENPDSTWDAAGPRKKKQSGGNNWENTQNNDAKDWGAANTDWITSEAKTDGKTAGDNTKQDASVEQSGGDTRGNEWNSGNTGNATGGQTWESSQNIDTQKTAAVDGWDNNAIDAWKIPDPNPQQVNNNANTAPKPNEPKTNQPKRPDKLQGDQARSLAGAAAPVARPETPQTMLFEQSLYEEPPEGDHRPTSSTTPGPSIPLVVPDDCPAVTYSHADSYTRAGDFAPYVHKTKRAMYLDSVDRPYAHFQFFYRTKFAMQKLLPNVNLEEKEDGTEMKKRFAMMTKKDLERELLRANGVNDEADDDESDGKNTHSSKGQTAGQNNGWDTSAGGGKKDGWDQAGNNAGNAGW